MSDIPEDVMKAADRAWAETVDIHEGIGSRNVLEPIARAIVAERERCFRIALMYADHPKELMSVAGCEIADAIRKGSK